jgi:hypothetical protein
VRSALDGDRGRWPSSAAQVGLSTGKLTGLGNATDFTRRG